LCLLELFAISIILASHETFIAKVYVLKNQREIIQEKFLTLWKDPDPGIAEVDARKRLAGLQSQ